MDNTYTGYERRRFPRVEARFIVTFGVKKPVDVHLWIGNANASAMMLNLSEGGMAILTENDIPVSSIMSINFTLINPYNSNEQLRPIGITGEVRNNSLTEKNEHRLGILFTRIAQEDRAAIADFVKSEINQ